MATPSTATQGKNRGQSSGRRSSAGGGAARERGSSKTRPEASESRARGPSRGASARSRSSSSKSSKGVSSSSAARGRSASRSREAEGTTKITTDHEEIRRWVEARGGKPACVRGTGGRGDTGLLRIDMPGYTGEEKLQPISWDEWFKKFEEKRLAFLYQDKTKDGKLSYFNKLVERDRVATGSRRER